MAATQYFLLIEKRAERDYLALSGDVQIRIRPRLLALAKTPRPAGSVKLAGSEYWRVRCGDYRILYEINDHAKAVRILRIRHRREVYRDM